MVNVIINDAQRLIFHSEIQKANTMPEKATIEPNDKSNSPEIKSRVATTAITPTLAAILIIELNPLSELNPLLIPKIIKNNHIIVSAKSDPNSERDKNFLKIFLPLSSIL